MTTQTAIIITQDYGASLSTPTLRNYLTDALIIAADSANEVTADSGRYALVFDETSVHAAGWYALRAFVSGAPINRFVYFTGVDGETAIAVDNLPVGLPQTGQVIVTRPVGDDTPITFSFPVASATLSGTRRINNAGSTTSLSGARSFLRTSGTQHLYSLAYNAADRPSDDGIVEYVFTDGTYSRTVVLKAVSAVLDSAAILAVADAVLRESILDHRNVAHSLAKFIWQIRQANLTIDGTVSNAITPTTLTFASNVVATTSAYAHAVLLFTTGPLEGENSPIISYNSTNGVFLLEEALTAAPSNGDEFVVIAGSHVHSVADIQSGLATAAALAAAKTILDKVDTGLVIDGAVYQFTANMLELGPSGSSTVTVLPATGIVADRSAGTTLTPVVGETISQSITVYQSDGTTAVSLSGKTLKVVFETMSGVDVAVVLAADITISGAGSNVVTFAYPSAVTASERTLRFAIRDAAAPLTMYLQGVCSVVAAPKVDA